MAVMQTDLTALSSRASAGDEEARFGLREHLIQTMIEVAAANAHVRRQMDRLGLKRGKAPSSGYDPMLPDLLSCTELGARLVGEIGEIDLQPVTKVLHRVAQGATPEQAVEQVARFTVLHLVDRIDSLVLVRKAIERGVRIAARSGDIEEIIGVGFRKTRETDRNIRIAVDHKDPVSRKPDPLIGEPLRICRLRDAVVAFAATASTWQKGENVDIIFRRSFIGPPGSVSQVVRESPRPWQELTQLQSNRTEVIELAKTRVRPLAPKHRKARKTRRQIVALPGSEIRRIARELAAVIGHPVDRAIFFAGLYATLSECGFETVARENDPTGPLARRHEESPEMDIIDRIDRERAARSRETR